MDKTEYLQAMGITVWRLRPTVETFSIIFYELRDHQNNVVMHLYIDQPHLSAAETQLVEALCRALQPTYFSRSLSLPLKALTSTPQVMVLMGKTLNRKLDIEKYNTENVPVISIPLPAEMIKDPKLKGPVWNQLKGWKAVKLL